MTAKKITRTFKFGPDNSLLGSITESSRPQPGMGAILWGMGVAEVQLARRLARQGVVSMQVRLEGKDLDFDRKNAVYDSSGIALCRAAMDKLASERGVTTFILMGNCAAGNLCFNTAVIDQRVVGLVLTNPHVSEIQTLSASFLRKPFKLRWWRRLLTGKSRLLAGGKTNAIAKLKWLGPILAQKLKGVDAKAAARSLLANYHHRGDVLLSPDFDEQLRKLVERGVKALMVCTHTEASLPYLQRTYGKTFHALQASGGFWLEIVKRDSHIFSKDDIAASQLNEIASKWLDNIPMPEAVATREPQEEPQARDLVAARPTEITAVSA